MGILITPIVEESTNIIGINYFVKVRISLLPEFYLKWFISYSFSYFL